MPEISRSVRTASAIESRALSSLASVRRWPVYGVRSSQMVIGRYRSAFAMRPYAGPSVSSSAPPTAGPKRMPMLRPVAERRTPLTS